MTKDITSFTSLFNAWKSVYRHVVVSRVEAKTDKGWRIIFARIVFLAEKPAIGDYSLETWTIRARRMVKLADDNLLTDLFQNAAKGQIKVDDCLAELDTGNGLSSYFTPPLLSESGRFPSIRFNGASKHNVITATGKDVRELDYELKTLKEPFDTLDELLSHCWLPTVNQMGDITAIDVIVISPTFIQPDSVIKGQKAVFKCVAGAGINKESLRLGYKIFTSNEQGNQQVDRCFIDGNAFKWELQGETILGTAEIEVKSSSLVQAFLSYGEICTSQLWIADPLKSMNERYVIHECFDKELETIKGSLFSKDGSKSKVFESAVSTLFYLCGFSVAHYGQIPKLQQGPDIIALTINGNILVIECTVGQLNQDGKLSKLIQRTALVRNHAKEAGYGHADVQPVIVSPLSLDELKADLSVASEQNIAVMSGETLTEAINKVKFPPRAEDYFKEIKKLVPPGLNPAPVLINS